MQGNKGFTLTEMIVVIAIIAILSAVLIPGVTKYISKAQLSSDTLSLKTINDSIVYNESMGEEQNTLNEILTSLDLSSQDLIPKTKKAQCLFDLSSKRFFIIDKEGNFLIEDSLISLDKTNWVFFTDSLDLVLSNEGQNIKTNYYFTKTISSDHIFTYPSSIFIDPNQSFSGTISFEYNNTVTTLIDGQFNEVDLNIPNGAINQYGGITLLRKTSGIINEYGTITTIN